MAKNEPEECFDIHIRILRIHGLWPSKNNGRLTLADVILIIFMYFPLMTLMAGSFSHTIVKYKLNVNDNMADDVVLIFFVLFWISFLVTLILRQNDIVTLMEELKDFREFGEPRGLKQLVSKQKKLQIVIYTYYTIGGLIYMVACYLLSSNCQGHNKVYAKTCGLPFPLFLPFEVDLNVKLFIIIMQGITFLFQVSLPSCVITCLAAAITENMQFRLKHLRKAVASIAMADTFEERRDLLKFCLKYYNSILRLEKLHEKYIGRTATFYLFFPAFIIGTLNYKIYYTTQTKDIFSLFGCMSSLVIPCHAGQGLLDESVKLSNEIYNLPWYNFEPTLKKSILLFLMRSQRPVKTRAGIFNLCSYELIMKVVKSSFSFMTLLNQLSNLPKKE